MSWHPRKEAHNGHSPKSGKIAPDDAEGVRDGPDTIATSGAIARSSCCGHQPVLVVKIEFPPTFDGLQVVRKLGVRWGGGGGLWRGQDACGGPSPPSLILPEVFLALRARVLAQFRVAVGRLLAASKPSA